ncbi:MAG: hypothetical protein CMJ79_12330 [Planctomycetaceae bacterium]|nr:hypothetical protein [Planctomycetaceae bacterium]|tara:strand:+ start:637 stop:3942 length:3306 start_codon:yes stop_codon:yes gene_type:complete
MKKLSLSLPLLFLFSGLLHAAEESDVETLPEGLTIQSVEVLPKSIELTSSQDYRQVLILGHLESGQIADLTRMATVEGNPQFVEVTNDGVISPVTTGSEKIRFRYADNTVELEVAVSSMATPQSDFVQDVQPLLSKMSCNAGTCHGAKDGKGAFKLSLRGYDELYDHRALTDDIGARRFNRAAPDQSLMLLKATGSIPHVGGVRTEFDSRYYKAIRSWITGGAKLDQDVSRVTSIEVFPKNPIIPRAGMKQQMTVIATFDDGSTRDVSREAFIESGNIEVIEADPNGLLTVLRRGEGPVLIRYEGNYAATTLTVMGDRTGFAWQEPEHYNYIDKHVYDKLQRVKVLPSDICTDEEFVRRVYIDVTGLPPTADQVRSFLGDMRPSKDKRDALIDELVGSQQYVEHWTNKWADLLQVNRKFLGEQGAISLRNWIKQAIAANRPYDQFAQEVLTATGSTIENPPASYYKVIRDPATLMENTTHLFLAVRFNCNKCHDHPFERWTQDQYYNLAAYFAQIGRKEDPSFQGQRIGGSAVEGATPLVEVVFNRGTGEINHAMTGQVSPPSFPYEHQDVLEPTAPRLEQLAQWMTSSENQYFASSYVNRLWGYMFGSGIIEPIDDIRAGNPPTNPELLEAMKVDFIESGFNVQHILKTILKSRTYQHSVTTNEWNEDDQINYSHAIARRLPAEVLFDSIHVACGSVPAIAGVPRGFRAAELPDVGVAVPFLDDFGRPVRESACECERSSSMVLGPIMKLVNGPTVANAIGDGSNDIVKLEAEIKDDDLLIEEVFLRFLSRYPTEEEIKIGKIALLEAGSDYLDLKAELDELEKLIPARQTAWEESLQRVNRWYPVEVVSAETDKEAKLELQEDGSLLATGKNEKVTYTVKLKTELEKITALRLEALADDRLPNKGPGRTENNGNFVVSEFTATIQNNAGEGEPQQVKLASPTSTFDQAGYSVGMAIDGNPNTGWAIAGQQGKSHTAIFQTDGDVGFAGGGLLTVKILQNFTDNLHQLGKFRVSVSDSIRPVTLNNLPEDLAALLKIPADQRNDEQKAQLRAKYIETDREYSQLAAIVAAAKPQYDNKRLTGLQDLAWALINNPAFLFNR